MRFDASPVLPMNPGRSGLDLQAVDGERRVGREVSVIELVATLLAEPEAVAAEVVPTDREHRSVRDRQQRPPAGQDVLAVMPPT